MNTLLIALPILAYIAGVLCGYYGFGKKKNNISIEIPTLEEKLDRFFKSADASLPLLQEINAELKHKRRMREFAQEQRAHAHRLKADPLYAMCETEWACQVDERDPNARMELHVDNVKQNIPNDAQIFIGTRSEFMVGVLALHYVKGHVGNVLVLKHNTEHLADDDYVWVMDEKKMERYKQLLAAQ